MKNGEKIATYCGQPLDEMTREQLMEALEEMAGLYSESLEQQKKILEVKYRFYFHL